MYREIREIQSTIESLQRHVSDAIVSTSTRDMVEHAGRAQVSAVAAKDTLDRLSSTRARPDSDSFGEPRIDAAFVRAAGHSLGEAIVEAEKVELGTDIDGMRLRLIAFKTCADFADAYLRAAIGVDGES